MTGVALLEQFLATRGIALGLRRAGRGNERCRRDQRGRFGRRTAHADTSAPGVFT